jgi:Carboxypeptidase regulatory-like domain/TonB dependent receptor-like, beta-barrel
MKMGRIAVQGLLLLGCLSILLPGAAAQYRASIQGVVTDPQGNAIADAKVTVTANETGLKREATTDTSGVYSVGRLAPGLYTVSVEKSGFKKNVLNDFQVIAEQVNAASIQLQVGQLTESITVNGDELPLLETESSSNSGSVGADEIQKLPSIGRDPFQLLQLAPGAFGDGSQSAGGGTNNLPGTTIGGTSATDGIFKTENGGQITANGARTGENNYTIDGVGMTSVSWGGTAVITPNEDSIKEVKVVTDNYDAEYGRYRGAQVQLISQTGTNNYHGSFYFKAHRPGLNAFQKYNGPGGGLLRDNNRFNDLGGSIGGPILRNKLFVFFSYEKIDNSGAGGLLSGNWYETDAFRALAASPNAAKYLAFPGVAPLGGTIAENPGDQHTCTDIGLTEGPFCHFIPGQGLDLGSPLTSGVGTRDPSYNGAAQPGFGGGLDGVADLAFLRNIPNPSSTGQSQYNGRVDFNVTSKDLVAFSIYRVPSATTSINGSARGMNTFNHSVINEAFTGIWDHTFSPTLINEARLNAAGWRWQDLPLNPDAPWGLAPISFQSAFSCNAVVGNLDCNNALEGYGIGAPGTFDQWTYGAKDVMTKVLNSHTLKFGGEVARLLFVDNSPWNARPTYYFNNLWDFLNDAPTNEQATFNPITGVPTDFRKDTRSNIFGFFVQDNWKVKSNLTLTFGLRWEYFGPISEKNGNLAVVQLGSGAAELSGLKVRTGGTLYDAATNNFGPQIGFAWSPKAFRSHQFANRLVVRGGFGISYNGLDEAISLNGRSNPPFLSASGVLSGSQILYEDSFPSDVHSFGGYASNPAAIATFDPSTNLPVPGTANFAPVALTGYPSTWPSTTSYHYTLGTQYDLGHQWVASLGYQGSTTRHLTQQYNLYAVAAAQGIGLNPVVSGLNWYANDGTANFNALLAELNHRFSRSFQIDAQYRYSKSLDSGSNNFANGNYQYDAATNYGPSDYDITHAFKLWGIWSPRIFRGSYGWLEKIAGGWSLSGIMNWHSGFPFNPTFSQPFDPVFAGSSGFGGNGNLRPAAYLGGAGNDYSNDTFIRSGANFPNGSATYFTAPTVVQGPSIECLTTTVPTANCPTGQVPYGPLPTPPGIGRNAFRGPRYFNVDATLSKSFGLPKFPILGESAKVEFRANFYNLFNKLNLSNVDANIGHINSDGSVTPDSHFGQAQNGLGSRVIEMQARFSF